MIKKDWHFDYLGKPWSPVPRPPESYNCGELVRYVHIDLFGIDSPIVPVPDANVMRACLGAMNPVYYGLCRKADEVPMQEFDVIFLGRRRDAAHCGIMANTGEGLLVLHCLQGHGVCLDRIMEIQQVYGLQKKFLARHPGIDGVKA